MSKTLSPIEDRELLAIMGAPFTPQQPIADTDFEIASATRRIRGQIRAAADKAHVGVRELAKRLGVSPAAVSRHLRSDGDIRVSTAVLFARALNMRWENALVPDANTIHVASVPTIPSPATINHIMPKLHANSEQLFPFEIKNISKSDSTTETRIFLGW
jgi:DNA-binding transcriptional ArsR family regulator